MIIDKVQDLGLRLVKRRKGASSLEFTLQNAKPYLDLVEPGRMLGRIVTNDAMSGIGLSNSLCKGCWYHLCRSLRDSTSHVFGVVVGNKI